MIGARIITRNLPRVHNSGNCHTLYYMSPAQRRTLVYSVRLSPDESNAIQRIADTKHLPASALVRAWILDRLEQEQRNG